MGGIGGLGLLLPIIGRFGWKGILVAVLIFAALRYGGDCGACMGGGAVDEEPDRRPSAGRATEGSRPEAGSDDELVKFSGFVLDDTQDHWASEFKANGRDYRAARMSVFTDSVSSGCGNASAAVGPFYCPLDHNVYVDVSFYRELHRRFGAPGDFAQAYVIAHEIGHHVQRLLGALNGDEGGSIETELQADCLAGAWAQSAEKRNLLEPGDVNEGMTAAAAVGDDAIQKKGGGEVRPETWTHGSSEQRQRAFQRGYKGGTLQSCGF